MESSPVLGISWSVQRFSLCDLYEKAGSLIQKPVYNESEGATNLIFNLETGYLLVQLF